MTSVSEVKRECTRVLKANLGAAKLDESGKIMYDYVFNITIGRFVKLNAKAKHDVWKDPKLSGFILLEAKMIAEEASKHAKNGLIDAVLFNRAALRVMRLTTKKGKCHAKAAAGGPVTGIPDLAKLKKLLESELTGDVCSVYLATNELS